jgi:hypothetical protein
MKNGLRRLKVAPQGANLRQKLPVRASQYFCLLLFPPGETSNTRIKFDIQNNQEINANEGSSG